MSQAVFTLQNRVEISMCQVKAVNVCDVCYVVMTLHTIFDVNHNKIEYFIEQNVVLLQSLEMTVHVIFSILAHMILI